MDDEETITYAVVVNHEEQYSIWPAYRALPAGWQGAGRQGTRQDCLAWITETWTDPRPLSLRRRIAAEVMPKPAAKSRMEASEPSLVERLCRGSHQMKVRAADAADLNDRIARGHVMLELPETRGPTVLGVAPDADGCRVLDDGRMQLKAKLTLDGEALELSVQIDLGTLRGTGALARVPPGG